MRQKPGSKTSLFNRLLFATAALSLMGAVSLSAALYFGYLPTQTQNDLANSEFAAPLIHEPGANLHLEAPPSTVLSGQTSDPYLLGVVGQPNAPVEQTPQFNREQVLADFDNRIDQQFTVLPSLKERVAFWFDVYSKYDQNRRIIHQQRHPWIIFKVIDVSDIINSDKPRVRWLRNEKADKLVKSEANRIRGIVSKIARGASVKKLNSEELEVAKVLAQLNPNIQKAARESIGDIRVQTGQKNFFEEGLAVSPRYLKTMEKIFRDQNLPIELTRLPFVESSFNKRATSKVGATGIWQFMGNTGRKFMLVNDTIDERRSPFKASEAAAHLLKENHMILGKSWPLAITAWNHGPAGVRKASKAAGSKDLGVIVAKYRSRSFDFASSNFYSEFLGALYAEKYKDLVFGHVEREPELEPLVVRVAKPVRFKDVLRTSGLQLNEFLLLNPDLDTAAKRNSSLPIGFRLHVPDHSRASLERMLGVKDRRIARR